MASLENMLNDTILTGLNSTIIKTLNSTDNINIISRKPHVSLTSQIVLTLVYICGVIGNVAALINLFYKDKRRNRKHLLMLRCLATNDLVALLGMLLQMYVTIYINSVSTSRIFCSLRIVWRLFGLFSGCVAIVMAAERWLALTRPFVYQKHVTYPMIVRWMVGLWIAGLTLTALPLFGFGLYYENGKCVRYRDATKFKDVLYAYVWFFFGTLLCLSIVWCNLAVSRVLRRLGHRNGELRRVSRSSSRSRAHASATAKTSSTSEVGSTAEERAFARLMAVLSISFVIFWMPQMISIPLAQYSLNLPVNSIGKRLIRIFHIVADILLCIHFTLDPYVYVLLHRSGSRVPLLKVICRICSSNRSRSSSFVGTTDHHGLSSEDPPTPPTEEPSTPLEEHEVHLMNVSL